MEYSYKRKPMNDIYYHNDDRLQTARVLAAYVRQLEVK